MTKKVLCIVGCILLGFNFGLIVCFSPIFLIFTMSLFPDDALNEKSLIVTNLIAAAVAGIGTYIYGYMKKREHENINVYGMTTAISFVVGAILMAIIVYIIIGDPNYKSLIT